MLKRLKAWWGLHSRCAADCGYRLLFGSLLLYTPMAALISSRTQAALYILLEGAAGWVTLGGLAVIGFTICADVFLNTIPDKPRLMWITRRREFLYILGSIGATLVPFPLARYEIVEAPAVVWYGLVFLAGIHLLFLDVGAKNRGLLDESH